MSRLLRRLSALGVAVTAASIFLVATPAHASVGPCNYWSQGSTGAGAYCGGFYPSAFRAKVQCFLYTSSWFYGPWRTAGGGTNSYAWCPTDWHRVNIGYEAVP